MKVFYALALGLILAACDDGSPSNHTKIDQCMRTELFKECLAHLPAGPVTTHYNDWDEVVESCDNTAFLQSIRPASSIKPQCAINR